MSNLEITSLYEIGVESCIEKDDMVMCAKLISRSLYISKFLCFRKTANLNIHNAFFIHSTNYIISKLRINSSASCRYALFIFLP